MYEKLKPNSIFYILENSLQIKESYSKRYVVLKELNSFNNVYEINYFLALSLH
jgi:hypothetical protein